MPEKTQVASSKPKFFFVGLKLVSESSQLMDLQGSDEFTSAKPLFNSNLTTSQNKEFIQFRITSTYEDAFGKYSCCYEVILKRDSEKELSVKMQKSLIEREVYPSVFPYIRQNFAQAAARLEGPRVNLPFKSKMHVEAQKTVPQVREPAEA